jgi:predicted secreted protein
MAKIISVSSDNNTFYTLPGNQGELNRDGAVIDDTIFGQTFKSGMTGIIGWGMSANAVYKGYAGYMATIKQAGSPTTMTAEALTQVTGKYYQITNAAHRVIDRATAITVYDGVTDVTANVEHIDYLFGVVKFLNSYTIVGSITVDGKYMPLATVGKARAYTLTQSADAIDTTDFNTASSNGGFKTFLPGLRTVTLELPGVYDAASDFQQALIDRDELIIEINPDGAGKSLCRGFFRMMSTKQSGNVGALEEETVSFSLSVPIEDTNPDIYMPFGWYHDPATTMPQGARKVLDAWLGETTLYAKYLQDGTNGFKGGGVVTNCSMSGAMDAMNLFQFQWSGSGAPVAVP